MPTTTYAGLRYPQNSDGPYGPQQVQNLATDVDTKVIVPVASSSARTALTGVPAGLMVYEQSTKRYYRYDGSAWQYAGGALPPIAAVSAGAGWSTAARAPGCYLDSSGLVHLIGGVYPASTYNPQDQTAHTAFQLPVGYRPAANVEAVLSIPSPIITIVQAEIRTDGVGYIIAGSASSIPAGVNSAHFLDNITFHPGYAGSTPVS